MDDSFSEKNTRAKEKRLFKGARFDVNSLEYTGRSGQVHHKEYISHPGSVVILPILDKDHIVMIQNERFAVGKTLWELPAGTIEPGEPPDETAARELVEETGYRANKLTELFQFYTTPGFCSEKMFAYIATDLDRLSQQLDDTEVISVYPMPWKEILAMIQAGVIEDAKTLATLLYYNQSQSYFTPYHLD